jgi:hypothetical protein
MNILDFKRAITAQPLFDGFWTFDSTASALSGFTITTSNPSEIVIVWGDNTTSTVASSAVTTSHIYSA